MSNYITSTCSADLTFNQYRDGGDRAMTAFTQRSIVIRGGANVTDKFSLMTPTGMVTEVTDEELEFLQQDPLFKELVDHGYLKVSSTEKLDRNLTGMTPKDGSAQMDDADHAANCETLAYTGHGDRHEVEGVTPSRFRS